MDGERNGKGKEYDYNNKLRFEGEYLNNKRWNGKGYNKYGQLVFELKNGCGQVKECYEEGLEFEGEYLNGNKNGKGKECVLDTNLVIFEGEYLNGEKNGKGKEYYGDDILKYEGEYKNGKLNGKGK